MRKFALAILMIAVFRVGSASQSIVDEHHNPVLVSVCQMGGDSDAQTQKTVVALVYEIGSLTATLYELRGASREPIAWIHYGSLTSDEFFEAQGGILSTEKAGEIFLFLATQPFCLFESLSDIGLGDYDAKIKSCVELGGDKG